MKAIVITDNNYRGKFIDLLFKMNKKRIRKIVKELIALGKAEVHIVENPLHTIYAKEWIKLGEIVFGKTEKIRVILI